MTAQSSATLGLDLGGTQIKAGVVDAQGRVLGRAVGPTGADHRPQAVVTRLLDVGREAADAAGVAFEALPAIGLGVPGPVDHGRGVVRACVNLGWEQVPIGRLLAEAAGRPVALENDANAAALGEFAVARADDPALEDLVLITLGTGIGSGVVVGGQLVRGAYGLAGEIGHLVLYPRGRACPCGQRGCLETYASATALLQHVRESIAAGHGAGSSLATAAAAGTLSTQAVFAAAAQGDALAERQIAALAEALALACINVCRVVDPQRVLFGGGLAGAGESLLRPIQEAYREHLWRVPQPPLALCLAVLGNDAGFIGAAVAAQQLH